MKESLFDEAVSLPVQKRAELIDILIRSLNPTIEKKIEKLWAGEAEKRARAVRKGSVETVPAEDVIRDIRKRLKK